MTDDENEYVDEASSSMTIVVMVQKTKTKTRLEGLGCRIIMMLSIWHGYIWVLSDRF